MLDRRLLGITQSVCATCRTIVPARMLEIGGDLFFEKRCSMHGDELVFVRSDVPDYIHTLNYIKPASKPRVSRGDDLAPCPEGCGFCERHEQHLCLPIIEITQSCDLACPICLVDAGSDEMLTVAEFSSILDGLIEAEKQIDILNLSGGEPLTHPDLLSILDEALNRREIVRVSISTNGLRFLEEKRLLPEFKSRNVVVSLQMDGFNDGVYRKLRGRPLLKEKLAILDLLGSNDITTTLTMTLARGINEDQLNTMVDQLFTTSNIVSLMIQPLVYEGRAREFPGRDKRITIPDVLTMLDETSLVKRTDFIPLPCSHPACFSLAFYLMLDDGKSVSLGSLFDAPAWFDTIANRGVFGLDEEGHNRIKSLVYDLWSGPAANNPESEAVLATVRKLLRDISRSSCSSFDPRSAFTVSERRIKSIFIHAFQDADTFDLARVRKCCNGYPQKDGRVIPACVRNVFTPD